MRTSLRKILLSLFVLNLISYSSADEEIPLVVQDGVWKYLDDGTDLGTAWRESNFDDSAWESGPAGLGFGNRGILTTLNRGPSSARNVTFYFRKEFNVTTAQLNSLEGDDPFYQILIGLVRDDGAVIYINGVELYRDNMPAGEIKWSTLASGSAGGTSETRFFEASPEGTGKLVAGKNVVAVEVHQSSPGSSDAGFNLWMSAFNVAPGYGLFSPPQSITFEDAGEGSTYFTPSFDVNNDLGWSSRDRNGIGGGVIGGVADFDWLTGLPLADTGFGFAEGRSFAVSNDHHEVYSQDPGDEKLRYRIDLRNYVDVKVSFDVRTYDGGWPEAGLKAGNGFETGDYIKFTSLTSLDGDKYTKKEELNLKGGGGAAEKVTAMLVAEDQVKKAIVPTEDIGNSWINLDYDDSSWMDVEKLAEDGFTTVRGGVGFARSGTRVDPFDPFIALDLEEQMYRTNASVYLRIPFTVEDLSEFKSLVLGARTDDGFVAWLNGELVQSFKAPDPVQWDSEATASNSDSIAQTMKDYSLNQHLNKLKVGQNILAIQALNKGKSGSDFLFSCQLEGVTDQLAPRNDPPENLNDLNRGINGSFYKYTFPIPDTANSYTFAYEAKCNENTESIFFDNFEIDGTPLVVDSYPSWIKLETPFEVDENGLPFADPDGDGISNFLEYAFVGNPEVPSKTSVNGTPIMPQARIVKESGLTWFELIWRQADDATSGTLSSPVGGFIVRDIKYIPQISFNCKTWADGTAIDTFRQIGDPEINEDGTVTITARYDRPIDDKAVVFGRVKIDGYKVIIR